MKLITLLVLTFSFNGFAAQKPYSILADAFAKAKPVAFEKAYPPCFDENNRYIDSGLVSLTDYVVPETESFEFNDTSKTYSCSYVVQREISPAKPARGNLFPATAAVIKDVIFPASINLETEQTINDFLALMTEQADKDQYRSVLSGNTLETQLKVDRCLNKRGSEFLEVRELDGEFIVKNTQTCEKVTVMYDYIIKK